VSVSDFKDKDRFKQLLNFNLDVMIDRLHNKIDSIHPHERKRQSESREVRFSTHQDVIIIHND
jgi:hypothetical protein